MRRCSTGSEVGDQEDFRVGDGRFQGQGFGQHHHGEEFPRAGGVPDHAPRAALVAPDAGDAGQRGPDGEVLLIAGDLLDAVVEDDELVDESSRRTGRQRPWTVRSCSVSRRSPVDQSCSM